ncbi:MFS transporter [Sphingopyxis sp. SE2]|uniref:spinster family MFS transporter n=1 Tax=unclassified Sphingopyxis TaxID=2614943 RepID=UPI00050EDC95|nr:MULTISPECIES: MFS transporter [unclassified Sphingopyxis]KGB58664.1 Major facilitator superfamily protein [Sphingopyxis sp. LC363]MDT7528661.1 MFS transporter [Sphingopyxis sp. SE2]
MTEATAFSAGTAAPGNGHALRRNVALAMLFVVGTINFVDRQLLSVLVEPIRAEMNFSDTQFGLLTGFAFALFYAAAGVPVAMIADRWNRVKLIGIACVVWSGFTAACGMVSNFWQLALMRFGVGAGEAGGTAPSLSVIADYYPPARRPLAIGLFTLNGPFGVFVGATFGAWAAANIGWRNAFIVIGIVGILVAPLLIWLVREPARGAMDAHKPADEALPFSQSLAMFIRRPSLRMVMIGSGLAAFVSYGMLNWIPAFLMRTQKMPLEAMATYFGPAAGITFGIGILGGGWLVSHRAKVSARAYGTIPALATAVLIPTFIAALLVDSWQVSLALMLIPMAACTAYVAPALALVQNLTPPRSRATAAAVLMLMFNIIGLGLGPLFAGIVSDTLKPDYGDESLRWALMALMPFAAAAGLAQYRMTRYLEKDFAE